PRGAGHARARARRAARRARGDPRQARMIVLDTTVLVYAKGDRHRFRDPCRELVAAAGEGRIEATTTAEVIQEFAHVRARRRGREDAAALAHGFVELFSPLLTVDAAAVAAGIELFRREAALGAFDAVLLAAAGRAGARAIVSADAAFASAGEPRHVLPDEAGVASLLG